jgi:hypothetical protein
MAWLKHFRLVQQSSTSLVSNEDVVRGVLKGGEGSQGTASKYSSFLPEVYAGHPNRIQRYFQYDDMDRDSDINAALDTIADFCTQSEEQTDEPFHIHYYTDDSATETEVKLINKCLNNWVRINQFRQRLWRIFRSTMKNGDSFFLRDPETQEWLWIDHYSVMLVKVDEENGREPSEYVVRGLEYNKQAKFATSKLDTSTVNTATGSAGTYGSRPVAPTNTTMGGPFQMAGAHLDGRRMNGTQAQQQELHLVDAKHVVHLSLSEGMDVNWPFGSSILEPIFKTYKQKEMLEDSIIIYRVQRAPERRIFYIDVGSMPAVKAKAHLQQIKNEIHQRRIPNRAGGGASMVDAAYNPMSMLEDYFFAQCLRLNTKIPLLDGRTLSLSEIIQEYEQGKINYTYSIDTKTHKFEPGKITWAGVTRKNAQMLRVMLDNGEYIDATPDHRFILRDGSELEAQFLTPGTSLMPLYLFPSRTGPKQKGSEYVRYLCNKTNKKRFVHIDVCGKPKGKDHVVHHKDFDSLNNNPENLEVMKADEHRDLHKAIGTYSLSKQWSNEEGRKKLIAGMRRLYHEADESFVERLSARNRINGSRLWEGEQAEAVRIQHRTNLRNACKRRKLVYTPEMFDRLVELFDQGYTSVSKIVPVLRIDPVFQDEFKKANQNTQRDANTTSIGSFISDKTLNETVRTAGYESWGDFKESYRSNHKVVSVEILSSREDTGDITVESASGSHVFAVAAGVYIHNSADGKGSKVETLPGGDSLGEIGDLSFFTKKMARGLRIPTSYLSLGEDDGQVSYQDGKLGSAMIQEYRFNKYCMRLQGLLAPIFDQEFKRFIRESGVTVDESLFELQFNPPQNFTKYRQIEIDAAQANVFGQVASIPYLSNRWKLMRFLGLTEEEVLENERMYKEENPTKIKKATGTTPAEEGGAGLSSIGIRPSGGIDDFGLDDSSLDGLEDEGTGEAPGGDAGLGGTTDLGGAAAGGAGAAPASGGAGGAPGGGGPFG